MESEQPSWSCSVANLQSKLWQVNTTSSCDSEGNPGTCQIVISVSFNFSSWGSHRLHANATAAKTSSAPNRSSRSFLRPGSWAAATQGKRKETSESNFIKAKKDLTGSHRPLPGPNLEPFGSFKGARQWTHLRVLGFRAVCSKRRLAVRGTLSGTSIL